jgi:hypothetical protein
VQISIYGVFNVFLGKIWEMMNRWDLGDPVAMEIAMEIVPFFHVPSTGVTK